MFEKGKKMILDVLERAGYSLCRKEDLDKRIEEIACRKKEDIDTRIEEAALMPVRAERLFSHVMTKGYPQVHYDFVKQVEPTADDRAIARRLLNFYRKCMHEKRGGRKPRGDIWEGLQTTCHGDFIRLLGKNDPESLAAYLCNMCRHAATDGFIQGASVYDQLQASEESRQWQASLCLDKLMCLAEALGCLPRENPEQGRFGTNLYLAVEDVTSQIEKEVGMNIAHPPVLGGLFGLDTSRGILDFRYISGIYSAWRIRQILEGREDVSVCEIGAGIGFTAHAASRLSIKRYTIFDLPYVAVMTGYYLIKSLPEARIILYGEAASKDGASISLYPYWHFDRTASKCFDLTLNQDSFPEIDVDVVNWYLESMMANTKDFFLSINQEGQAQIVAPRKDQVFVSALLKDRKAYKLTYRFPYWLREGYTEELYRIVG